jgi:hypothetical protein
MSAGVRAKRFPAMGYLIVLVVIVFLATLPLISVFATYLIADANACTVNEANVHPCVVMGTDIGGLLYFLGMMGWFMLATIPLGAMAVLAWLVVLVIHYLAYRAANTNPGPDQ